MEQHLLTQQDLETIETAFHSATAHSAKPMIAGSGLAAIFQKISLLNVNQCQQQSRDENQELRVQIAEQFDEIESLKTERQELQLKVMKLEHDLNATVTG